MKKIGLSSLIAGLLLANGAGAEPVAVDGGTVFILSNGVLSAQPDNEKGVAIFAKDCFGHPRSLSDNKNWQPNF